MTNERFVTVGGSVEPRRGHADGAGQLVETGNGHAEDTGTEHRRRGAQHRGTGRQPGANGSQCLNELLVLFVGNRTQECEGDVSHGRRYPPQVGGGRGETHLGQGTRRRFNGPNRDEEAHGTSLDGGAILRGNGASPAVRREPACHMVRIAIEMVHRGGSIVLRIGRSRPIRPHQTS